MDKKVDRGIIQGDSLSPLLFVIAMDPLSRLINSKFPMLEINRARISSLQPFTIHR